MRRSSKGLELMAGLREMGENRISMKRIKTALGLMTPNRGEGKP